VQSQSLSKWDQMVGNVTANSEFQDLLKCLEKQYKECLGSTVGIVTRLLAGQSWY